MRIRAVCDSRHGLPSSAVRFCRFRSEQRGSIQQETSTVRACEPLSLSEDTEDERWDLDGFPLAEAHTTANPELLLALSQAVQASLWTQKTAPAQEAQCSEFKSRSRLQALTWPCLRRQRGKARTNRSKDQPGKRGSRTTHGVGRQRQKVDSRPL